MLCLQTFFLTRLITSQALKAENIPYVVAPYEADAQLAYLERTGIVDGILTEDSDLLVFGCQNVFFKLDTSSDSVISISRSDFGSLALAKDSLSLIGWTDTQFRWMAMLSGCDYLPSIAGIGLKTAYHLLRKYKAVDKAVKMIQLEGNCEGTELGGVMLATPRLSKGYQLVRVIDNTAFQCNHRQLRAQGSLRRRCRWGESMKEFTTEGCWEWLGYPKVILINIDSVRIWTI